MNQEQALGIIRWVAAGAIGWLTGKGYVNESTGAQILAAVAAIAGALWSVWSNRTKPTLPA